MKKTLLILLLMLVLTSLLFAEASGNDARRKMVTFSYGETFRIGFSLSDMEGHTGLPTNPLPTVSLSSTQAGGTLKYVSSYFYLYFQVFISDRVTVKILEANPLKEKPSDQNEEGVAWTAVSYPDDGEVTLGEIHSGNTSNTFSEPNTADTTRPRVYSWEYRIEVDPPNGQPLPDDRNLTGNLKVQISIDN